MLFIHRRDAEGAKKEIFEKVISANSASGLFKSRIFFNNFPRSGGENIFK
jgi:hypothetical protein